MSFLWINSNKASCLSNFDSVVGFSQIWKFSQRFLNHTSKRTQGLFELTFIILNVKTGFQTGALNFFDEANQVRYYIVNSLRTWEYPIGDPAQILN